MVTSFLTSTIMLNWELTYFIVGQFCAVIAIVNIFLLVVHPEERDIEINEIDDQMSKDEELLMRHTIKMQKQHD